MIITIHSLAPAALLPEELKAEDRPVYLMPDRPEKIELAENFHEEPLLRPVPGSPGAKVSFWSLLRWWFRFLLGLGSFPESARQAKQRARSFTEMLMARNETCVVAADPVFLELFLHALRRKGFVVRRSSVGPVREGEKIFLSQRKDHCGGCSHNCLLQNPGCGVGRDKARRGY